MSTTITPLAQATALDPKYYTCSDTYDFEIKQVISPGWQVIAPASAVSEPGDMITRQIGGVPILVVRTQSGELKGYYNICPHRAGPVAQCDAKGVKALRCGYHGWTYNLDGQLRGAHEMKEAQGFDRNDINLTAIEVKIWNGTLMAKAGTEAEQGADFDEVFAGIDEIVGDSLKGIEHHKGLVYDVQANWKVYADNYLEGYHLPFVHPGLTRVVDYTDYTTELGKWWSLQRSPVDNDCGAYGAGEGLYFFVHPNMMLNIMPGRLQTNRIIPTGLASCKVEFDFYYTPDNLFRAEEDLAFTDTVQEEDRTICEHVQKGLTSGVYRPGRLSPSKEAGVWHWQNILREIYAQANLG